MLGLFRLSVFVRKACMFADETWSGGGPMPKSLVRTALVLVYGRRRASARICSGVEATKLHVIEEAVDATFFDPVSASSTAEQCCHAKPIRALLCRAFVYGARHRVGSTWTTVSSHWLLHCYSLPLCARFTLGICMRLPRKHQCVVR
jgi:hypothetical protein